MVAFYLIEAQHAVITVGSVIRGAVSNKAACTAEHSPG